MDSTRNKVCGETSCVFSTSPSDAKERSASMRKLSIVVASSWEANPRQSYGFSRIEILGALVSVQLIWLLTGVLVYEAITRLIQQSNDDVNGFFMVLVCCFWFSIMVMYMIMNIISTEQLLENSKERRNINVQGAYLHVLGDLIQSVGVMIRGGLIWYNPKWKVIDLICTLVLSKGLLETEEVVSVHELHIWAITVGKVLFSCHVKIKQESDDAMVLNKVIDYIRREYRISHVTIQIER
ncbi:hypothetical protein BRARA_I04278 [Brassica rapa]|uniref:Cation efflux protein cytoplasmic domain-containing protein n=1 Tax=Brassica campestris TaxID=3711 RepID=A0A397YCU4_BRACM|nr:hypothetical protein BRARA_I04278 [Brassica rapa]